MIFLRKILSLYKKLISENRRWLYLVVAIFGFGFLSGLITSQTNPLITKSIIASYSQSIDKNLSYGLDQALFIAERNIFILLFTMVSSLFFGVTGFFVTYVNGAILGLFVGFSEIYQKINPWQFFWLLLPHGIVEYSASFLGLAFGLRLGLNWALERSRGKRFQVFLLNLKETFIILILVVLLLLLAAFIEGYLTQIIACTISGICVFK